MKCPRCDDGRVKVEAVLATSAGWVPQSPVWITCHWCAGTGELNELQQARMARLDAAWCGCGNPSGQATYYTVEGTHYHGWLCGDCGKIVQAG